MAAVRLAKGARTAGIFSGDHFTPPSRLQRLRADQIAAQARFNVATRQRQAEAEKAIKDATTRASQVFSRAYASWLYAKSSLEDPEANEKEMARRLKDESDAERGLFTTPAAYSDQWLQSSWHSRSS